jgi:hypothetical protein
MIHCAKFGGSSVPRFAKREMAHLAVHPSAGIGDQAIRQVMSWGYFRSWL